MNAVGTGPLSGAWCLVVGFCFAFALLSQQTRAEDTNSQEMLRSYLQLQEQLHATQLAVEQNRRESREAAAQNEEALTSRLSGIEQALAAQRARELEAMQSSSRVMLIVAGSFAGIGFIAMLIMAYFQWRTVHSLAEISAGLPLNRVLGAGHALPALGLGDIQVPGPGPAEQSNQRLLGALEQLEKRLDDLKHSSRPSLSAAAAPSEPSIKPGPSRSNGNGEPPATSAEAASRPAQEAVDEQKTQIQTLLRKGESFLDLDDPQDALACFDEILALAPGHAEALVKKGSALERLQKLDAAIECYDQAIAKDSSLTIAYLQKGGLCNRLERFKEALECYEKALRSQEKPS